MDKGYNRVRAGFKFGVPENHIEVYPYCIRNFMVKISWGTHIYMFIFMCFYLLSFVL